MNIDKNNPGFEVMSDDDISSLLETIDNTNISINNDTTGCSPSPTHGENALSIALERVKHQNEIDAVQMFILEGICTL